MIEKHQEGFGLFEMMIVLFIISILLFFAYPYYEVLAQRFESNAVRRYIYESIRVAKIESYVQDKDVIICAMNTSDQCSKVAQQRLVVFLDNNHNNQFDIKDDIVSSQPLILKYGIIDMRASLGRDYMKFMGDTGKPRGNFGHIKYCNIADNKQNSFQVVINAHGVVSLKQGDMIEIGC
ncbi:prepilin-type N-terminal cleavage/methylation domain-containing protein [Moraxella haemolytica]|uniref:pilus assembly FimT family protein n=1 Tax=Moraxella TaxID=475 RepID=UPI002542C9B6|nr:prepilin-type N-terminal cleavage/methylation domain-containing protein [Moraxella sp. ZY171148]WII95645.1 prepilin-type N-terminal cleavage/methylation domain-containing protein [Moraxella sp. ZY171148]